MADEALLKETNQDLQDIARDAARQDQKVESKYEEYTREIKAKKEAKNRYEQSMDEAKDQVKANDADNAAAEIFSQQQGGQIIDISSALQLVDQEQEAKSALRQLEADALKAEVDYLGYTASSGLTMAFSNGDSMVESLLDGGIKGKAGTALKTTLGLVAGSFVTGSILQHVGEDYTEAVSEGMSTGDALKVAAYNAIGLNATNEVDEDVEAKPLEGDDYEYTSDDETDAGDVDKPLPEGEDDTIQASNENDVLAMSREQFEETMQNTMSKLMSSDQIEALTNATTLMSNIAEGVAPGMGDNVFKLVGAMGSSYAKLQEQKAQMDEMENSGNNGPEGPSV